MAIAALEHDDTLTIPWPRPSLRLLEGGGGRVVEDGLVTWENGPFVPEEWAPAELAAPAVRRGVEAGTRRRQRAQAQLRRRRLLAGAVLVGLLLALAAPVTALGGRPATHPAAVAAPATRAPATVYVVRPGDTLASIAVRMSHGHDAAGLAAALSSELGTAVLTPGERIVLP